MQNKCQEIQNSWKGEKSKTRKYLRETLIRQNALHVQPIDISMIWQAISILLDLDSYDLGERHLTEIHPMAS